MNTDFKDISVIELSSSEYGENLNQRLSDIDHNFQYIVDNSFIKGDKGDGLIVEDVEIKNELSEYYLNGSRVNLFEAIKIAIAGEEGDEVEINNKYWYSDLIGTHIQVIYTKVPVLDEEQKHIQSIFPFTYIDSRFKNLQDVAPISYQQIIDHSCSVSVNDSGFVAYQNTPTIFWNEDLKDFCWKINGNQTDIVCRGPEGTDGLPGSTYVVYVSKESERIPSLGEQEVRNVLCVLGWYRDTDGKYKYGQIKPADFKKCGINLETGLSVFAFPATPVDGKEEFERVVEISDSNDPQSVCMISHILKTSSGNEGEYEYRVYSGPTDLLIFQMIRQTTLRDLLNGVGDDVDGSVKGLYVPSNNPGESGVVSGHMMWADGKTLNMGHVGDTTTLSSDPDQSTLQLTYNTISLNSPNTVKLLSSQEFDMSCDGDISVQSDGNIEVQSDAELNLKSTDAINLDSYEVNITTVGGECITMTSAGATISSPAGLEINTGESDLTVNCKNISVDSEDILISNDKLELSNKRIKILPAEKLEITTDSLLIEGKSDKYGIFNENVKVDFVILVDSETSYTEFDHQIEFESWGWEKHPITGKITMCMYPPQSGGLPCYYNGRVNYNGKEYESWYWEYLANGNTDPTVLYITPIFDEVINSPSLISVGEGNVVVNGEEVTISGPKVTLESDNLIIDSRSSTLSFAGEDVNITADNIMQLEVGKENNLFLPPTTIQAIYDEDFKNVSLTSAKIESQDAEVNYSQQYGNSFPCIFSFNLIFPETDYVPESYVIKSCYQNFPPDATSLYDLFEKFVAWEVEWPNAPDQNWVPMGDTWENPTFSDVRVQVDVLKSNDTKLETIHTSTESINSKLNLPPLKILNTTGSKLYGIKITISSDLKFKPNMAKEYVCYDGTDTPEGRDYMYIYIESISVTQKVPTYGGERGWEFINVEWAASEIKTLTNNSIKIDEGSITMFNEYLKTDDNGISESCLTSVSKANEVITLIAGDYALRISPKSGIMYTKDYGDSDSWEYISNGGADIESRLQALETEVRLLKNHHHMGTGSGYGPAYSR